MPSDTTAKQNDAPGSWGKQTNKIQRFFAIPAPVKKVFDKVPFVTYAANELPQRAPRPSKKASLYVFSTEEDAARGNPSYNPSCLKWQVSDGLFSSVREEVLIRCRLS
jgi:metaxin